MRLVYPTKNPILRFIGDVLLTFGSWLITIGERWGGVYEFDVDFAEDDDIDDV